MFSKIMVPVDLAHVGTLGKALETAAQLAKADNATVTYVGVTGSAPGSVAHTPEEYREKLAAFAADQAKAHGHKAEAHAEISHDPAVDLDPALLKAATAMDADLIVMQSHVPGLADHLWPSNGGTVGRKAHCSVMIVRD